MHLRRLAPSVRRPQPPKMSLFCKLRLAPQTPLPPKMIIPVNCDPSDRASRSPQIDIHRKLNATGVASSAARTFGATGPAAEDESFLQTEARPAPQRRLFPSTAIFQIARAVASPGGGLPLAENSDNPPLATNRSTRQLFFISQNCRIFALANITT